VVVPAVGLPDTDVDLVVVHDDVEDFVGPAVGLPDADVDLVVVQDVHDDVEVLVVVDPIVGLPDVAVDVGLVHVDPVPQVGLLEVVGGIVKVDVLVVVEAVAGS